MSDYFEKQLANMSGDVRENPTVLRMKDGIASMRKVLGPGDAPLSEEKVREISRLSADLLKNLHH